MTTQNSINAPMPFAVAIGGTGLNSLTAHGILIGEGTSAVSPIVLTNGELLIGSTGADPVGATITAGSGISVTNGAGTITIANTGPAAFTWSTVTSSTQAITANNGYVSNDGATLVTFTLPAVSSTNLGDTFIIVGLGSGLWKLAQNASQSIQFGNVSTTAGVTGYLASSNQFDNVKIVSTGTDTWAVLEAVGNITYA